MLKPKRSLNAALLLVAGSFLAGCTAFPPASTPMTSSSRDATAPLTRHEMCARACNRRHDICDEPADTRFDNYGEPHNAIGMGATCNANLKDCLNACARE